MSLALTLKDLRKEIKEDFPEHKDIDNYNLCFSTDEGSEHELVLLDVCPTSDGRLSFKLGYPD